MQLNLLSRVFSMNSSGFPFFLLQILNSPVLFIAARYGIFFFRKQTFLFLYADNVLCSVYRKIDEEKNRLLCENHDIFFVLLKCKNNPLMDFISIRGSFYSYFLVYLKSVIFILLFGSHKCEYSIWSVILFGRIKSLSISLLNSRWTPWQRYILHAWFKLSSWDKTKQKWHFYFKN